MFVMSPFSIYISLMHYRGSVAYISYSCFVDRCFYRFAGHCELILWHSLIIVNFILAQVFHAMITADEGKGFTTIDSKYWGTKRISQRTDDFSYTPSERPEQHNEPEVTIEAEVKDPYTYELPPRQGEGVIIYMIESEVSSNPESQM